MTNEDIFRMALDAGIYHEYDSEGHWDGLTNDTLIGKDWISSKKHKLDRIVEILSPFAALVAASERKACANVCADIGKDMTSMAQWGAAQCESAIKSRGLV